MPIITCILRKKNFKSVNILRRYLILNRPVHLGPLCVASWDPTRDEQVFAHDLTQDSLLFAKIVRTEISALSAHVVSNKSLQSRSMISEFREQHSLCDSTLDVLSPTRIEIEESSTPGGISESGCSVVALAEDKLEVRRVSTVTPIKIQGKGGSGHEAEEQLTRVPLSPHWTNEYCCLGENSMDLRGAVHAQQSVSPSLRALANCVGRNSSLTGKLVIAVPKLLPQPVIGEVRVPKPYPVKIKSRIRLSKMIVGDVVLPRSNDFNATVDIAVVDGIALSLSFSQLSASATPLSWSCSLGPDVVQFQIGLLSASPSVGLQKSKLLSWFMLNKSKDLLA